MALWVEFLANNVVPYAAHRALETGRLTALDKQPGVRSIGVASAASRSLVKCLLKVIGDDAKAAYGNANLCAGLEAGIEGALHVLRARATDGNNMEFVDWEIDHAMFVLTADEGVVRFLYSWKRMRTPGQVKVKPARSSPRRSSKVDSKSFITPVSHWPMQKTTCCECELL